MSESFNLDKAISLAINSGKTAFGAEKAIQSLETGDPNPKAIVLSANCPSNLRNVIRYNAELGSVMLIDYPKNSFELGAACGRPHKIAVLTIYEAGDSRILKKEELEAIESDTTTRRGRRKKKKK
ncbi:MAG: 50S ribosomal protein L30e [Candidatus Odinarchaeota archaeon]